MSIMSAAACAVLAGCGSVTKTASTSAAAPEISRPATATAPPATASTPSSSTPTQTGSTPAPTSTRTAPEPAFTQQEAKGQGLSAAVAVLRVHGYQPSSTADYHADQALQVLVGTRAGSSDGHVQQAFFFVNGRYIGTDAIAPSAMLRVAGQSDTEVTLAYGLYRKSDPLCCPGGGQARVRFQLDNGKLSPLDPIPPASSGNGSSRL
jgi:hypothetical protein